MMNSSTTQLRAYNATTMGERIAAIQEACRTPVVIGDDDPRTLAMARTLGHAAPRAGDVFAVSGAVAVFAAEMVETACCLGSGKAGIIALEAGAADVL